MNRIYSKKIAVVLAMIMVCGLPAIAQETISLAGAWSVRLDEQKTGEQQQWYKQTFQKKIQLPGTLDDGGIGNPASLTVGKPEKEVLLHLTRKHAYVGYAWYAREIVVPQSWQSKHIELYLERVLWNTKVWIDGQEAGAAESLSTPQRINITGLCKPGRHLIVLRIDNSKQYDMSTRDMAHAYTDGTQIIWNGVIGKLQLTASNKTRIRSVQVYPSLPDHSVTVSAWLQNDDQQDIKGTLRIQVLDKQKKPVASRQIEVQLSPGEQKKEMKLLISAVSLWDEFNPYVYTMRAEWMSGGTKKDSKSVPFGMRTMGNSNSLLQLNGRRLFLRGTLECNIFPLTGYPPMNNGGWIKVFNAAKAYGLNHLRFHSWCPPEAAFQVADSLGMYLQIELPFWNKNAGKDTALNRFLHDEAIRISEEFGNHPSFCFWSMGNELEGDFNWLAGIVNELKKMDPRHLYTSTTFSFQRDHGRWPEPTDDFFITQYTKKGWVRGQGIFNTYPPDFKTDYTKAIDSLPVPIITHEIGQYSVYPNMKEIKKYTGVLEPLNFKTIRNDLQQKQLLALAPAFTLASGKFSANLYKEEIERALKTKGMSGFQLLDLHDFPGQGTALIGILDAFWDSKGLVTPEEHCMYCSAVVPLLRFEKATYTNNESFTAVAEVANFSNRTLKNIIPVWTAKDQWGKVMASGRLQLQQIEIGNGFELGTLSFDLSKIQQAAAITIELSLQGTTFKNKWTVWVYPQQVSAGTGKVVIASTLAEALPYLEQGKRVLLNPDTANIIGVEGRFAPVFWSPVHFPNQPGTMGLLCNPQHPALKSFPTDFYSGWQWWDMITASKTMILDSLPALDPVVRVIDNFFKNRKMGNIIEAKVGKGKLLLVSMDITHNLDTRPAARQLRYSLEQYMNTATFNPSVELSKAQLNYLVK
jgi:hypothetical protein